MKKIKITVLISLAFIVFSSCTKDSNTVVFCGNNCPSEKPWRVESLDLGLPCFSKYDSCRKWAVGHGYADKPCVKCD
jgi:hypothetical protein